MAVSHQAPSIAVMSLTSARPPRRPRAEAERSLSIIAVSTFAASCRFTAFGLSRIRAIASAACANPGHASVAKPPTSSLTADSTEPSHARKY